jgi:hypothetical protein
MNTTINVRFMLAPSDSVACWRGIEFASVSLNATQVEVNLTFVLALVLTFALATAK